MASLRKYKLPPGLSFFRTYKRALKLVSNPIVAINENLARFGDTYTVHSGISKRIILTRDPAFIDHVLRKNHKNYHKSPMVSEKLGRFLGNGLLTSNGAFWLRQRRLIQPGFHLHKVQALYSIMAKTTAEFLKTFPTGEAVDVLPLMNKFAFQIVIRTLFDVDIADAAVAELGRFITDVQEFVVRDIRQPHKSWWYALSGEVARNKRKSQQARAMLREIIQTRKSAQGSFNDLLDMLLKARYEDTGDGMSDDQLIDEILILIIAGHETTANALSWTLYLLSSHPEEMEKLRNATSDIPLPEIVLNAHLAAVINESMRLYPPAWVSDRVALEDDEFKSFTYPRNTIVILLLYAVQRDERFWKDAQEFRPDRFIYSAPASRTEIGDDKVRAFYPFGAGPRLCIGNNFALAEMSIFLQAFLRSFSATPVGPPPRMKPQVTLRPEGILLDIVRR